MNTLKPGFADPVRDAQATFRAVMTALSFPGRVVAVAAHPAPPPPLDPATAAVLLALADRDTPLWLDADCAQVAPWVAFHCGAVAAPLSACAFAVALSWPGLADLQAGTDAEPQDGATLILQIPALTGGRALTLRGPGLAAPAAFAPRGLPADFAAQWGANHARFPRGVDLILCAGTQLAALPRSTHVTPASEGH